MEPRVQAPATAVEGEIFQVKTLINHVMETGLRHDSAGHMIPRNIMKKFSCHYNGAEVFSVVLHEAMSANPYLLFHVRAAVSGDLRFVWEEDGGAVFASQSTLTVTPA